MKTIYPFFGLLLSVSLFGNPQGPVARNGNVSIESPSPEFLQIHVGDQAIIDWSSFSIELGEKTEFIQPDKHAVAINRVTEASPSRILGELRSNGKIILTNPNGILVGTEAIIDTGSLIASTLDLNTQIFLSLGELVFEQGDGTLVNEGTITAQSGDLFLIGNRVENRGSLQAGGHSIGTVGAQSVLFKTDGGFYIRSNEACRDGQNPFANAFSLNEGEIVNPGGDVFVLANAVQIKGTIDTSSPFRGGRLFIGGDYQGSNSNLSNAYLTLIEKGASLKADALQDGDGGRVIVWSNEDTLFEGTISARGTGNGAGGFAEVSGKRTLQYFGFADLRDELGKAGTLLLDPLDLAVIAGGGAAPCGTIAASAGCLAGCPACAVGGASSVSNANLTATLGACNVTLTTLGTVGACSGDIFIGAPIPNLGVLNSGFTLTIQSAHDIFVNADIQQSGAGGVTLTAARNIVIDSNSPVAQSAVVGSRNGTTNVTAGGNLTINGSNAASRATQIGWKAGPADNITGNVVVNVGGNIALLSGTGASDVGAVIGHGSFGTNANVAFNVNANINVRAGGAITLTTQNGSRKGTGIGVGSITTTGAIAWTTNINVTCGGNLLFDLGGVNVSGGCSTIIGTLNFATFSNANSTFDGSVNVTVGGTFTTLAPTGGNFFVSGIGTEYGNLLHDHMTVTATINGATTLNGPVGGGTNYRTFIGKMDFSGSVNDLAGAVTVTCCNNLTINGNRATFAFIGHGFTSNIAHTGSVPVNVAAANITLSNAIAAGAPHNVIGVDAPAGATAPLVTGDVTVITSGNIAISGNGDVGINANGNVTVQSQGNITTAPAGAGLNFIGTERPATTNTASIFSGGNILGTGNTTFGNGYIAPSFAAATHTNTLDMEAAGNIQIPNPGFTTAHTGNITVLSDANFAGASQGCITAASVAPDQKGAIFFPAGTNPLFQTENGFINFLSAPKQVNNTNADLTIGAAATNARFASTSGNITIRNFHDININQTVATAGNIDIEAQNNINVNTGGPNTSTGTGNITLISGIDSRGGNFLGVGDINLKANVTSNSGIILLQAGAGAGCYVGRNSAINQTAGTLITASGQINLASDSNISLASPISMTANAGSIHTLAGLNTSLSNTTITGSGLEILMISGNNMSMSGSRITAPMSTRVVLVVDNCFPVSPLIGPGAFIMSANSSITGDPRIFTALQSQNTILGPLNGTIYTAGTLFQNTSLEHWCQYFAFPFPYPFSNLGDPYTIFYKNCLQLINLQAALIESELLYQFIREFPGWKEEFYVRSQDRKKNYLFQEPFFLRRRLLHIINHPKSWTVLVD